LLKDGFFKIKYDGLVGEQSFCEKNLQQVFFRNKAYFLEIEWHHCPRILRIAVAFIFWGLDEV
jgi:hypothetical protein